MTNGRYSVLQRSSKESRLSVGIWLDYEGITNLSDGDAQADDKNSCSLFFVCSVGPFFDYFDNKLKGGSCQLFSLQRAGPTADRMFLFVYAVLYPCFWHKSKCEEKEDTVPIHIPFFFEWCASPTLCQMN